MGNAGPRLGMHFGHPRVALAVSPGSSTGSAIALGPIPSVATQARKWSAHAAVVLADAFRRAVSLITLTFPLTYLFLVLIGAGVLRPELIEDLHLRIWTALLSGPVHILGNKIFVGPTTYRGVDFLLLGCAVLFFAFRSMLLGALAIMTESAIEKRAGRSDPPGR